MLISFIIYIFILGSSTKLSHVESKKPYKYQQIGEKIIPESPEPLVSSRQSQGLQSNYVRDSPRLRSQFPNYCQTISVDPKCLSCLPKFRSVDGSCNNLRNSRIGATLQQMQRLLEPTYGDGRGSFRKSITGGPLPNARHVSLKVHGQSDVSSRSLTIFAMQWGQLVDHEITFSPSIRKSDGTKLACCGVDKRDPNCAQIDVSDDEFYNQFDVVCLGFARTQVANTSSPTRREQQSISTCFLDGSIMYGSEATKARSVRSFKKGQLLSTPSPVPDGKPMLLLVKDAHICDGQEKNGTQICAAAGDARPNENVGITILQTLVMRQHNNIASELSSINPQWNDERLFQETRKIIGAVIQHITYSTYLPIILGPTVLKSFGIEVDKSGWFIGYDDQLNPAIFTEFSTAAYRFGHSLIPTELNFLDENFEILAEPLPLRDAMLNPLLLYQFNNGFNVMDALLRSLIFDSSHRMDVFVTAEVRNHLFELANAAFGMDLPALNSMRGRDHGIRGYRFYRELCGLSSIETFDDLINIIPNDTIGVVQGLYKHVDDLDLFAIGTAEFPVKGGVVGPTFACIIATQFRALKFGDSFWYENFYPRQVFSRGQLSEIRKFTFSKLICDNADNIQTIQRNAFLKPGIVLNKERNLKNDAVLCSDFPQIDLTKWRE